MSNAKEFEQARLSPALRHPRKTVSKAGQKNVPAPEIPALWSRARKAQADGAMSRLEGWICSQPSNPRASSLGLVGNSCLSWLIQFFPNLWWDSHMGCGICEAQITLICKEQFGKYTADINILSFECLHSHMPMYNIASQKNTFKIIIVMNL